jgi:hypothetical protein
MVTGAVLPRVKLINEQAFQPLNKGSVVWLIKAGLVVAGLAIMVILFAIASSKYQVSVRLILYPDILCGRCGMRYEVQGDSQSSLPVE